MYANESKGERYPPLQAGRYQYEDASYGMILDLAPSVPSIYPEYLTDPNIAVCPSDSEAGSFEEGLLDDAGNPCFGRYVEPGGPTCMSLADISYVYLGYCLDQWGQDSAVDISGIVSLMGTLGYDPGPLPANPLGPQQLVTAVVQLTPAILAGQSDKGLALTSAVDEDLTGMLGWGNGRSDTLYRLREGIERFLITDINNPAASAMAQSGLPIMGDQLATDAAEFNHIPGGSNVLFLDGHVSFHRYQENGEEFTNGLTATVLGLLAKFL